MIGAAAVVPEPLCVLPEYASLADPGASWRDAAARAVAAVCAEGDEVVVLAAGTPSPHHSNAPAGMRVAAEYLRAAGVDRPVEPVVVGADATPTQCAALGAALADAPGRTALIVVADGSARRGPRAPGHLDERSFAYDDVWRRAVARGDHDALAALDAQAADDLLAQGRAPLQVLAAAAALDAADRPPPAVDVLAEGDPFGVAYLVATWTWAR